MRVLHEVRDCLEKATVPLLPREAAFVHVLLLCVRFFLICACSPYMYVYCMFNSHMHVYAHVDKRGDGACPGNYRSAVYVGVHACMHVVDFDVQCVFCP